MGSSLKAGHAARYLALGRLLLKHRSASLVGTALDTDLDRDGYDRDAVALKLLADGDVKAKLSFDIAGASKAAIEKIEKAGGSVKLPAKAEAAE